MAMDQYDCARIPAQREPGIQAVGAATEKVSPTGQPVIPWGDWLAGRDGFGGWSTTGRPEKQDTWNPSMPMQCKDNFAVGTHSRQVFALRDRTLGESKGTN